MCCLPERNVFTQFISYDSFFLYSSSPGCVWCRVIYRARCRINAEPSTVQPLTLCEHTDGLCWCVDASIRHTPMSPCNYPLQGDIITHISHKCTTLKSLMKHIFLKIRFQCAQVDKLLFRFAYYSTLFTFERIIMHTIQMWLMQARFQIHILIEK